MCEQLSVNEDPMREQTVSFDASASALGFLHQVRWALYELLVSSRRPDGQSLRMTLEIFDDVALTDDAGAPLKAVQLKQHGARGTLTDQSVDLWKTLRVWLETPSLADTDGPALTLVTTSPVGTGSAASLLGIDDLTRDVEQAMGRLDAAAKVGKGKATEKGREAWLNAAPSTRVRLLTRLHVLGEQANVAELDDLLDIELAPFVQQKHLAEYRTRLWGWWNGRALNMLLSNGGDGRPDSVSAAELYERMQLIRDDFATDALIVDADVTFDEDEIAAGHSHQFVDQLRWVKVGESNLHHAVVDYLRAYAHTTKWVQNGDLFDDELEHYEGRLKDEWTRRFSDMLEDLETSGMTDPVQRAIEGRKLFRALSDSVQVRIRPEFDQAFHARGTRNKIANVGTYGWHPDFKKILSGAVLAVV